MSGYLADTTLLVDHLRGDKKATSLIKELHPYISLVTEAELIQGSKSKRGQIMAVKTCLAFSKFSINSKISEVALELMKKFYLSRGLEFLDALIAATALENKLVLVTNNLKHFQFIASIKAVSHQEAFT